MKVSFSLHPHHHRSFQILDKCNSHLCEIFYFYLHFMYNETFICLLAICIFLISLCSPLSILMVFLVLLLLNFVKLLYISWLLVLSLMYSKVLMLLKCEYFQLVSRIFYNFKLFFCHRHFSLD